MPDSTSESWTYNANGDVTMYAGNGLATYVYNDAGDQTLVDYPQGQGEPNIDVLFAYYGAGRTISMTDRTGTSSWTFNAASEVTSLTTPQGVMNYAYNLAGEQTSMTEVGGTTTTDAYDAYGNRLTRTVNGATKTYSYDEGDYVYLHG